MGSDLTLLGEYALDTNSFFLGLGGAIGGWGLNRGSCDDGSCF